MYNNKKVGKCEKTVLKFKKKTIVTCQFII